jgi:hypothetical protein
MSISINDSIDRIAHAFTVYCASLLNEMMHIQFVDDSCETPGLALNLLVGFGAVPDDRMSHLKTARDEIPRLKMCLERMHEIKHLARAVYAHNFPPDALGTIATAVTQVFNQEVSFSYASKMLVSMGPLLQHYASHPTQPEIVRAEIAIAMKTPIYLEEQLGRSRKSSLVTAKDAAARSAEVAVPQQRKAVQPVRIQLPSPPPSPSSDAKKHRAAASSADDLLLLCSETMPTPKQIRRSRPHQPERSCCRR